MEGVSSEDNEIFIEFSPDAIHKVRKYYHKCYLCSLINLKGDELEQVILSAFQQ